MHGEILMSKAPRSGGRQHRVAHAIVCPTHSELAHVTPRISTADATCETVAAASITVDCAVVQTADSANCPVPKQRPREMQGELTGDLEQSICFLHLCVQL